MNNYDWIGFVRDAQGVWGVLSEDGSIDADPSWSGAPVEFVPVDEVPPHLTERLGAAYQHAMEQAGISAEES